MSIPGSASPLFLSAAAAEEAAAGPTKSLRFNPGDSAYLNKTFSSGNRKTFTYSYWIKESGKGTSPSNNPHVLWSGTGSATRGGLVHRGTGSDANELYIFNQESNTTNCQVWTNSLHRDFSAWKHIVWSIDTTQATSTNRVKLYINGVQETLNFATTPAQNLQLQINVNQEHRIGRGTPDDYGNFYLADIHFIDGSALDATSFGAFDDNGVWQAAEYSGTFGTNGFHLLDFANESTVGHDSSGNENDFTANNFSTAAGSGNDVLFDVPTNGDQSDTGAGGEVSGNYPTWNPLDKNTNITLSNGNLDAAETSGSNHFAGRATFKYPATGKWYYEATVKTLGNACCIGVDNSGRANPSLANSGVYLILVNSSNNVQRYLGSNFTSFDNEYGNPNVGSVLQVAYDADADKLWLGMNNVWMGSGTSANGNPGAGTEATASNVSDPFPSVNLVTSALSVNFGQRPFAYSAPSGFKALCTTNLPTPTIADGSNYFDAKLYTGNGSTQTVSGLNMSPDLVWLKSRSAADNHSFFDSVRGAPKGFHTNRTDAEFNDPSTLTGFTSDGWTMAGHAVTNANSQNYVGWAWNAGSSTVSNTDGSITSNVRASQTAGISIVTYTGSGSAATVGHGLNAVPEMIILKGRNFSDNWRVYHKGLDSTEPEDYYVMLESTNGRSADQNASFMNDTAPTNSVFSLGTDSAINGSSRTMAAYCFAPVAGFSAMGTYVGNYSSDGPFVYTGFRPAFLMWKNITNSGFNWGIIDSARGPINYLSRTLNPNAANVESGRSTADAFDFLSNGFKVRASGSNARNQSGSTFIWYAVAENPFQANGGLAR